MVLSEELLKKVRRIELRTRKIVDDLMGGQYRSLFKGYGVQFSDHRVYLPGDDVRHIDWKVSARSKEPLIKKFEEERELTVLLVVDGSGSEEFGTTQVLKSEALAEIAGMLAYAASQTGDRVGLVLFSGKVEKIVPPRKGRSHVLRIIRDILAHRSKPETKSQAPGGGTDLNSALQAAGHILKHLGVVFVLSDFLAEGFETSLKRLSRRHDVIAIWGRDPREQSIPKVGRLLLEDPETGEEFWVDTDSFAFREWLRRFGKEKEFFIESLFKSARVEKIKIFNGTDYAEEVVKFFRKRKGR